MKENKQALIRFINSKKIWIAVIIAAVIIVALATVWTIFYLKTKDANADTYTNNENLEENNEFNISELENAVNSIEEPKNINEKKLQEENEKEVEKEKEEAKKNGQKVEKQNKYYIKVNIKAQVINIYTYDKNGKYTVPVKAFVCSTGSYTPKSGTYTMVSSGGSKRKVWPLYGGVYGQYVTPIVGSILFHSVPYLKPSHDSLEYWEYDKLGTKASLGCIRLTVRDAKWIYDNVSLWTKVEFYSSSNPGPLGKPTAQKISNAPSNLKNWDPTDPDSKNPWKTYKPEADNKNEINNTTKENNEVINDNNTTENNTEANNEIENNTQANNAIESNNTTKNNNTTENNLENENNNTIKNELENNEMTNTQD